MKSILLPFTLALFFGAASFAHAVTPQVTAELDPTTIAPDETAQLTVTIVGASGEPTLPTVPGLEFTNVGQTSNFSLINGTLSSSTAYSYQITADRTGTFSIPPIAVGSFHSNPLTLTVTGNSSSNVSGSSSNNASNTTAPTDQALAFLEVVPQKKELYVGEIVPAEVRAYFRNGLQPQLDEGPTLESDAFILNQIHGKPKVTQETIHGETYLVLSWPSALTAVKSGSATLSLSMPVTVQMRERQHLQSPPGMPGFNDPIFNQMFGTVVEKQLTLHNEAQEINVLPLPEENRPANFSGAVGDFTFSADVTPRHSTEGDPLTLRAAISGHGNFDRVLSTLLPNSPEWKTYPPSSHFTASDTIGYEGSKTFEQAVIPNGAGTRHVPPLSFSFFNPETRQYVTRTTTPLEVTITAAPHEKSETSASTAPAPSATPEPAPETAPTIALAPNKIELVAATSSLRPVYWNRWFWIVQLVPILATAIGIVLRRRFIHRTTDPERLRLETARNAIAAQLDVARQAAARHDTNLFFAAARTALRQHLGLRWNLPPQAITLAEVEARTDPADPLRALFQKADAAIYSGQTDSLSPEAIQSLENSLRTELQRA